MPAGAPVHRLSPQPPPSPSLALPWAYMNTSPTTHTLPRDERRRLMRSARKLEAMLGETPLLVDTPASPRHNRAMSAQPQMAYTPTATGSHRRAFSAQAQMRTGASTRPLLVIDVPQSKLDVPPPSELLSTGSGSTSSPPSPLTPTNTDVDAHGDAARRRKLAKVSHMLGENVPPALVFSEHPSRPGALLPRRAGSLSVRRPPSHINAPAAMSELEPKEPEVRSSTSTFSSSSQEHLLVPHTDRTARGNDTHRREARQGWSGEWSGGGGREVHTMEDVVRGLRSMRAK